MSQEEYKKNCNTPEAIAKRIPKLAAWRRSDDPKAIAEMERIRNLNPMTRPEVRAKVSRRLREIGHAPSVRGGNGRGMTRPQAILLSALGPGWEPEFAIPLGGRISGYPTSYKVDLADPAKRIAIEVDGNCHYSRKDQDAKKDAKLTSLGWTVLRFWNREILAWSDSGMPTESSIFTTLRLHGILPTA